MPQVGRTRTTASSLLMALAITLGTAQAAWAVKPAAPAVSASICYALNPNAGGQPLLVTLWSYTAPRGADQVRGLGSTDGGTTWTNFDTRGTNGDSSRAGSLFVSVYDWTASLVKVDLMRSVGTRWKVLATSATLTVAWPLDTNPSCPANWGP